MKKLNAFLAALVLSISSVLTFVTPHAFAAPATWDGGGSDNNMMTAANWTGNTLPTAGDDLIFPANMPRLTVANNFTAGTSFNSITFSGITSQDSSYTISGNAMTVVAGVTSSMTGGFASYQTLSLPLTLNGNQTFQNTASTLTVSGTLSLGSSNLTLTSSASMAMTISGVISGSGSLTKTGAGTLYLTGANAAYSGAVTISAGHVNASSATAFGTTAAGTTVGANADLTIGDCNDMTIDEDFTLTGASADTEYYQKLTAGVGCSGGGASESYGIAAQNTEMNFTGDITLGSDITFGPWVKKTTLTGALSGDHTISLPAGWGGQLVIDSSSNNSGMDNGTYDPPVLEKTLSDDLGTSTVIVSGNTILTLDGKRSDVTMSTGTTLKGTGSAGAVFIADGATIAPGHSPGCLTMTGLTMAGTYAAEIGGTTACTDYDQLKVNGTVDLTGGSLTVSRHNGFKPVKDQKYTIIENDASGDKITGTFTDLAEGATFTIDGYVMKISYVGGDGNDVVLTVQSVPAAPDTGFALMKNNPILTSAIMIAAAAGVALAARKGKFAWKR